MLGILDHPIISGRWRNHAGAIRQPISGKRRRVFAVAFTGKVIAAYNFRKGSSHYVSKGKALSLCLRSTCGACDPCVHRLTLGLSVLVSIANERFAMDGLKFPEWQETLRDAILERDGKTLDHKIENAERLISLRFLRLQHEKDCLEERQALIDALYLLRLLKRKSLIPLTPKHEADLSSRYCVSDFPAARRNQKPN